MRVLASVLSSVLCLTVFGGANAQLSPQTQDQVRKLTQHLFSVFTLRNELRLDPQCAGRSYPDLDLNLYVDAHPKSLMSTKDATQMRTEFPKLLEKLYVQKLPTGVRTGSVAYDTAVQQWMVADLPSAPRERCDRIFYVIRTGYDRLLSDVRQLQ